MKKFVSLLFMLVFVLFMACDNGSSGDKPNSAEKYWARFTVTPKAPGGVGETVEYIYGEGFSSELVFGKAHAANSYDEINAWEDIDGLGKGFYFKIQNPSAGMWVDISDDGTYYASASNSEKITDGECSITSFTADIVEGTFEFETANYTISNGSFHAKHVDGYWD